MSTLVLPSLVGLGIEVTRTPLWKDITQQAVSGKETRQSLYSYPRYQWDLMFNVLRGNTANSYEFQQLLNFFNARQGRVDTFLFTDPDDNTATGQQLGTGNGSTASYQLLRGLPVSNKFIEPILAPNTVSAVYLNSVSIPSAGYGIPNTPVLSTTSGGSLVNTTYYAVTTWVTNSGETQASVEANLSVTSGNLLVITAPTSAPTGAIGWNAYVSNTAGGGSTFETRQNNSPIAVGTNWTEPTTGLVMGIGYPLTNTTGWTVSSWGNTSPGPGILSFAGNVANTVVITADYTYYWPVRMAEDKQAFNQFLPHYYKVKKFSFMSVKN